MTADGRAVPDAAWQAGADASEVLGPESGLFAALDPADFGVSTLAVLALIVPTGASPIRRGPRTPPTTSCSRRISLPGDSPMTCLQPAGAIR